MSCAATLTVTATESSTYIVNATFTDEEGDPLTPTSLTWTLTDDEGNVINSRSAVVVSSPASSNDIVLSGDDLDPGDSEQADLIFTTNATYNSSLGSGLPLVAQCKIPVSGLVP